MSSLLRATRSVFCWGTLCLFPLLASAQNSYVRSGTQYLLADGLPGDQTALQISVSGSGGYAVWQDNVTDGDGFGISARRVDRNFNGSLGVFRVNVQGAGDQTKPHVALLSSGGAMFVWQGGTNGATRIYARILGAAGSFITGDVQVNTFAGRQVDPVVVALDDGSALVAWSSWNQDGSYQGVFAQILSETGTKLGSEFMVNQSTLYNQRNPAVAPLPGGRFVVTWISESGSDSAGVFSVDIIGRLFNGTGAPGNEFRINSGTNVCAHPAVSASAGGGFVVAWSQLEPKISETTTNSWDIYARPFNSAGQATRADRRINTFTYGDQYVPKVAGDDDHFIVWTSMGQDGSREGVFGQFVNSNLDSLGEELAVNTATANRQIGPGVVTDGAGRYAAFWSGFIGGAPSFELFAQRYELAALPLPAPSAPFVSALSQTRLSVAWPSFEGLNVDHFELVMDGAGTPVVLTSNLWTATALAPGSTHSFRLAYQLADGRRSVLSEPASGVTWGEDENNDGLPDDWQAKYWIGGPANWPSPQADSDGDGASNLQEFLAGTDPSDPNSVLRTEIVSTSQGTRVNWNSQPGLVYQVQSSVDLSSWTNVGTARFAVGTNDSILVTGAGASAYYRIQRLR